MGLRMGYCGGMVIDDVSATDVMGERGRWRDGRWVVAEGW